MSVIVAKPTVEELTKAIVDNLSMDLLKMRYRTHAGQHPLAGHCYVASEALYHLLGGKSAGIKPMFIYHEGLPHWWLKGPNGETWDITETQFKNPVPHDRGASKGFLTSYPSKRAWKLMGRVKRALNGKAS